MVPPGRCLRNTKLAKKLLRCNSVACKCAPCAVRITYVTVPAPWPACIPGNDLASMP